MTLTEAQRDFLDRPLHAIVAATRRDGTTLLSTVWFLRDGDELWFSTPPGSAKVRLLRRDPRLSLLIPSEDGGAYLTIEGTATITEDIETADRLALMRRYVGDEGARETIARRPQSRPNARVRVHPTRIYAYPPSPHATEG